MENEYKCTIFVAMAASLWGTIGIFSRYLNSLGITPFQTSFSRCLIACIIIGIFILIKNKELFKIDTKDIWMFIGTGVIGFTTYDVIFITAQQVTSLSVATVLLYTAPSFVMLMSVFLFKERLTWKKVTSLVLAFTGCILATGMLNHIGTFDISFLIGILSGFSFALYSIFAKIALKKYDNFTILFYSFLLSSITLLPLSDVTSIPGRLDTQGAICFIAVGALCTAVAYILYTKGLAGLDASKASILCFIEPMVATIVGLCMGDRIGAVTMLGISLILASVLLLSSKDRKKESDEEVAG